MRRTTVLVLALVVIGEIVSVRAMRAAGPDSSPAGLASPAKVDTRLVVLWTSGDPEVAHKVCLMYTHAAVKNKWFTEVRLIVWGPSARLLVADKDLQAKIRAMMADGIKIQACVACADSYGVSDRLREMGIEVKGMGQPLTDYIQGDWKVLTF